MNIRATERHFSFLASCVTGYDVKVSIIDDRSVVGFTQMPTHNRAYITLSYTTDLYKGLSENQKLVYMLGVLAHEALHLCYTAFDAIKRKSIVLSRQADKDAFHEISNVVEDPAIEYAASKKIGGQMLKALSAIIKHTWDTAPGIHEDIDPQYAEASVYTQVIRAMIQAGDRGSLKGHFLCDTARDVFAQVLPLFNAAIVEPDGEERAEYYVDIYRILEPYSRKEAEEMPKKPDHGKPLSMPNGMGDGEPMPGDEDESDDTQGQGNSSQASEESAAGKKQAMRKAMEQAAAGEDNQDDEEGQKVSAQAANLKQGKGKGKNQQTKEERHFDERPFEASSKNVDDLTAIDEDMIFTAEDIEALMSDIEQAEMQIQISEATERMLMEQAKDDLLEDTPDVINHKANNPNEERYNDIVQAYAPKISTLTSELRKIFMNDRSRTKTAQHGSRVNTKRLIDGKLHSNIMLQRTHPKDLDDMAIYLLIDKSGSMSRSNGKGKRNDQCAAETAICLYEALRALRVPVYITGFTTRGSKAVHMHYVTWHSPQSDKYTLANFAADDCNYDYYSIMEATRILKKHPAKHKLLIVISDGAPCNPMGGMHHMDGVSATAAAVVQARKTTDVLGVALNCFDEKVYASMYGKDYITVSTAHDMFLPISETIQKIVKSW